MTVKAALNEAQAASKQIQNIESATANVPGKSLWGSCVNYFDGIVSTLNMILYPYNAQDRDLDVPPTPLDVQTWLSAGLTYITVSEKGFELINMTNLLLPSISANLTKLLLNSLSISTAVGNTTRSHVVNEPIDLNISDEYKLAVLAAERPDAVVARDGSGNFRTIQEAVNSAVNQKPNRRYVIYVKAGVYNEYVDVPVTFRYITMYGDGIGKTIITGNRHCGGDALYTSKAGDLQGSATFS
ncbi:putative pectinesterase/pectinesterase inhibitor 33 [Bidens hawaiensis]|uniref:putative pectinesterase/pectinesterase inhibitor 33 n=1 Tax=Bidens hawaiensis TaxID=980011 RepID=UPI004049B2F6